MSDKTTMKTIAIVTGGSNGLGKEFVKLLVKDFEISEVWVISRNEEKLNRLKEELGDKVRVISMDLTDRENFRVLEFLMQEECVHIKYLVNSAAFAKFCSYKDISIYDSLSMIDLNITALVAMGLICMPYMDKGSRVINIASQASFQPLPYQNIYSSTKAFVRNYTRALNVELKDEGICATAVCPGWMKTGLIDRALIGAKKGTTRFPFIVTPDVVAEKALKDVAKCKDMSVYGSFTKFAHVVSKVAPQKVMMKLWLLQQRIN